MLKNLVKKIIINKEERGINRCRKGSNLERNKDPSSSLSKVQDNFRQLMVRFQIWESELSKVLKENFRPLNNTVKSSTENFRLLSKWQNLRLTELFISVELKTFDCS